MLLSTLAVLLTFGLVIFLHEFGHFLLCRRLGVRVIRFSFGFGPEIFGVTAGGTRFSICAVPLGGYVKPAGESLEDCTGQLDEYFSRSPWQRLMIVAAGPVMNYFLAFLLFFIVVFARGMPEPSPEAVVGELAEGYPGEQAGLKSGDRVLKVDGIDTPEWAAMAEIIHGRAGREVALDVARGGENLRIRVTPRLDPASGKGLVGILPRMTFTRVGPLRSAREAAFQCWYWTAFTVKTLWQKIYRRERPDLAGPVGIVQMVSRAAHSGAEDLVFLIGLISVAIGFFNLLPVPLLDGGHAVLYLWEGVSRRKLTVRAMTVANSVGLAFLVTVLLFATYNDILRLRMSRRAAAPAPAAAPSKAQAPQAPAGARAAAPAGKAKSLLDLAPAGKEKVRKKT
jgi:regulator of sigma E protease